MIFGASLGTPTTDDASQCVDMSKPPAPLMLVLRDTLEKVASMPALFLVFDSFGDFDHTVQSKRNVSMIVRTSNNINVKIACSVGATSALPWGSNLALWTLY